MKNFNKKFSTLAICLLMTVLFAVSGTLAYLFTSTDPITNTFTVPKNGTGIVEPGWDGVTKSNVTVQNTGDVKSFIRVKLVVNWQNDTNVIPAADGDYSMTLNTAADENGGVWVPNDGFWYYNKAVEGGASTGVLISNAVQLKEAPAGYTTEDGYKLHIEVLAQSVQAEPVEAVTSAWGIDPSTL